MDADLTKGTVSLQTPMPFEIKKEPGTEENCYLEEEVKIDKQNVNKTQHCSNLCEQTESQRYDYEKKILDMEK